jgi:hypothetical protein
MTNYKDWKNVVFFDLETKRGAAQVGWSRINRMGMSLAVTYSEGDGFQTFLHDDVQSLICYLMSADAVVGFNHIQFDYEVLSAYTAEDLAALNNIDMLLIIYNKTRRRISLDKLAQGSLGRSKSGNGLDALRWYKEGRFDLIEKYCREDVAITRDLYYHGCDNGFVSYFSHEQRIDIPVDWALELESIPNAQLPSKDVVELDFLRTVHQLGDEFALHEAIEKVCRFYGLDLGGDSNDDFSFREERLFKSVQHTALDLSRRKCVEQSRPGYWKVTNNGDQMLRNLEINSTIPTVSKTRVLETYNKQKNQTPETEKIIQYQAPAYRGPVESHVDTRAQSTKRPQSAQGIKLPNTHAIKKLAVPTVAEIHLRLLQLIHRSNGQVAVQDLIRGMLDNLTESNDQIGEKFEETFFRMAAKASDLLLSKGYAILSKPGYLMVTNKGRVRLKR